MRRQFLKGAILGLLLCAALAGHAVFFYKVFEDVTPYNGWFPGFFIDFKNTWFGAWSWWHGELRPIFDAADFNFGMRRFFALEGGHIWSYPLHFLMLTIPLGALPFPAAALLWTAVGLAAYAIFLERTVSPSLGVLLLVVLSGGFLNTIAFGQLTFFAAILLAGGLAIMPSRPVLAGIAFGLLTIKPHFGILLPAVLLLERRWTTIAAAAATAIVLLGLSLLVVGREAWELYVHVGMPAQTEAMLDRSPLWAWQPSWYAALRQLRVDRDTALAVQGLTLLASVAALACMQRAGVPERVRHDLVPLLTLFALPYVLPSDLLLIAPLLALRLADERAPLLPWTVLAMVLTLSGFFFVTSRLTGLPLFAVLFTLGTGWMVSWAMRQPEGARGALPSAALRTSAAPAG